MNRGTVARTWRWAQQVASLVGIAVTAALYGVAYGAIGYCVALAIEVAEAPAWMLVVWLLGWVVAAAAMLTVWMVRWTSQPRHDRSRTSDTLTREQTMVRS